MPKLRSPANVPVVRAAPKILASRPAKGRKSRHSPHGQSIGTPWYSRCGPNFCQKWPVECISVLHFTTSAVVRRRLLLGLEQTSRSRGPTSEFDPERTYPPAPKRCIFRWRSCFCVSERCPKSCELPKSPLNHWQPSAIGRQPIDPNN